MILIFYLLCQNLLPRSFLMEPRTGFPFESSFCSYPRWPCFLCRVWRTLERKLSLPSSASQARNGGYWAQRTHEMGRGLTAKVHSVPADSSNTSKTTFWKELLQKKRFCHCKLPKEYCPLLLATATGNTRPALFFPLLPEITVGSQVRFHHPLARKHMGWRNLYVQTGWLLGDVHH